MAKSKTDKKYKAQPKEKVQKELKKEEQVEEVSVVDMFLSDAMNNTPTSEEVDKINEERELERQKAEEEARLTAEAIAQEETVIQPVVEENAQPDAAIEEEVVVTVNDVESISESVSIKEEVRDEKPKPKQNEPKSRKTVREIYGYDWMGLKYDD